MIAWSSGTHDWYGNLSSTQYKAKCVCGSMANKQISITNEIECVSNAVGVVNCMIINGWSIFKSFFHKIESHDRCINNRYYRNLWEFLSCLLPQNKIKATNVCKVPRKLTLHGHYHLQGIFCCVFLGDKTVKIQKL